jgi:hypothetical protein
MVPVNQISEILVTGLIKYHSIRLPVSVLLFSYPCCTALLNQYVSENLLRYQLYCFVCGLLYWVKVLRPFVYGKTKHWRFEVSSIHNLLSIGLWMFDLCFDLGHIRRCQIKNNIQVSKFPRANNQFIYGSIFVSHVWCPIKKKIELSKFWTPKFPP